MNKCINCKKHIKTKDLNGGVYSFPEGKVVGYYCNPCIKMHKVV